MSAQFTPGPWFAVNRRRSIFAMTGSGPRIRLLTCGDQHRVDVVNFIKEDCQLIAAAPELYSSLQACATILKDLAVARDHSLLLIRKAVALAEAVLAKARGEIEPQ